MKALSFPWRAAALLAVSLVTAGSAPAATISPLAAPELRIDPAGAAGLISVDVTFGLDSANVPASAVTVRIPKGYTFQLGRPSGTPAGLALSLSSTSSSPSTPSALAEGALSVGDLTTIAADPAAQACDPNPHLAALIASLESSSAPANPLTVFVDGPGTDPAASYLLEFCPAPAAGQQLVDLDLVLDSSLLVAPTGPAVYEWSAFVTPRIAGTTTPDPTKTVELRADVPVPDVLTLRATYDQKTHEANLTGTYAVLGKPQAGARIALGASSKHVESAAFGPALTDAQGRYTYRRSINETTDFTASIDSTPATPCTDASTAPGGCLSSTTSGPPDALAIVTVRSTNDPQVATRRADMLLAAQIDLKLSDLPSSWQVVSAGSFDSLRCAAFQPKESDLTVTGAHSAEYLAGSLVSQTTLQAARSTTAVFSTADQAKAYFGREAKLDRIRCQATMSGVPDATLKSIGPVAFPKLGRGSLAFRIALTSKKIGLLYLDEIAVLGTRSVTFVDFVNAGKPSTIERGLAVKIAARASRG